MNKSVHILGIAGSLRQRSYNKALLNAAASLLPADATLSQADLGCLPLYNADLEAKGIPEPILHFRQAIRQADALLIATPEYNYSIPGVLKNALDWASRSVPDPSPLNDKPVAIMGAAGRFGSLRAQLHLREILQHNNMPIVMSPQVYISRAFQEFDDDLQLINERYRDQIARLLAALKELTLRYA